MIAGSLFPKQIIGILGANEAIWQPTLEYAHVLMLFMVRFDSDPNLVLAATGACATVNLILDILFVGLLQMGPSGVALATSLAYTTATLLGFTHFLKKKHSAAFRGQDRDA